METMMEPGKRKLTPNERERLKMSRELLRGRFKEWPEEREHWLAEMVDGRGFLWWEPGEKSREVFEQWDKIHEAARRNVEEFGGGQV